MVQRRGGSSLLIENGRQKLLGVGVTGLHDRCLAVMRNRFLRFSLPTERVAEVHVGFGKVGADCQCLPVTKNGCGRVSLLQKNVAEIV